MSPWRMRRAHPPTRYRPRVGYHRALENSARPRQGTVGMPKRRARSKRRPVRVHVHGRADQVAATLDVERLQTVRNRRPRQSRAADRDRCAFTTRSCTSCYALCARVVSVRECIPMPLIVAYQSGKIAVFGEPVPSGRSGQTLRVDHTASSSASWSSADRSASRRCAKAANQGSGSAANALRPIAAAATEAEHKPPNGSQTASPGPEATPMIRRMKASGFWLRCAAAFLPGLYTRGAARRPFPR